MSSLPRRVFLASAAGAVWSARSYAAIQGANNRLKIGVIGCGGMAGAHMDVLIRNKEADNAEIVAVCDVYEKRLDEWAAKTGGQKYKDYHALLASKDIDYVLIATPEHWHAQMILDALDAGKHVYVEKPMTHTIAEGQKVLAKLKTKPNARLQVGVQGMSDESYETARGYIEKGVLGKVVQCQIDYSRNHLDDYWAYPIDPDAKPGVNLDWKAWLGPAPKVAWDPNRFFRWRWFWDYSGGIATDLFVHRATRLIKALNLTVPQFVVGTGGKFEFKQSAAEVPDTFNVLADYPQELTMQLVSTMANDTPVEHMIRGHKATLTFNRTGFEIQPQRLFAKDVQPVTYTKQGRESVDPHHKNLQDAIRNGAALRCDAQLGYYGTVVCDMSVQSYRQKRYLKWDANKNKAVKA